MDEGEVVWPGTTEVALPVRKIETLPSFTLPRREGQFFSKDLAGAETVIAFLAPWLPDFSDHMQRLTALAEAGQVRVLAIMVQESQAQTELLAKRGRYTVELLADPTGQVSDRLGVRNLPTFIRVNKAGIVERTEFSYSE
jgi:peroxiredoxin